jgi:hypothetical protein
MFLIILDKFLSFPFISFFSLQTKLFGIWSLKVTL